ncbi:MAG: hypothetical protein NVV63_00075 [Opitutus sp.]|nr:hypothetical protein [Opitutus sp.]
METHRHTLQLLGRRADQCVAATLERRSIRLAQAGRLAETLSHKSVLKRGFALIRDADDQPVKSAAHVRPGDVLSIEFADGRAGAVASGTDAPKPATRKSKGRAAGSRARFSEGAFDGNGRAPQIQNWAVDSLAATRRITKP